MFGFMFFLESEKKMKLCVPKANIDFFDSFLLV